MDLKLAKNILTCIECGERLIPARGPEVEDRGDSFRIPVTCPNGCKNDDKLIDKRITVAIRRNVLGAKPMKPMKPFKRPLGRTGLMGRFQQKPAVEKVRVTYRIPDNCPKCKAPISGDNVHWIGPMDAKCPYCEAVIHEKETEI